jgi:hypothetical protein
MKQMKSLQSCWSWASPFHRLCDGQMALDRKLCVQAGCIIFAAVVLIAILPPSTATHANASNSLTAWTNSQSVNSRDVSEWRALVGRLIFNDLILKYFPNCFLIRWESWDKDVMEFQRQVDALSIPKSKFLSDIYEHQLHSRLLAFFIQNTDFARRFPNPPTQYPNALNTPGIYPHFTPFYSLAFQHSPAHFICMCACMACVCMHVWRVSVCMYGVFICMYGVCVCVYVCV